MLLKNINILLSAHESIKELCVLFKDTAENAIEQHGFFSVALSGGKTPNIFFHQLSLERNFPWKKTFIFQVDERYVPSTHTDSNLKALKENLLDKINFPKENLIAVDTKMPLDESVDDYANKIKKFFAIYNNLIIFDFILLGIGDDGHTASIFPNHPEQLIYNKIVIASGADYVKHQRISLTIDVINKARKIIFLALGESKKDILPKIIAHEKKYPAALIAPTNGELVFFVDKAAAKNL